MKPKQKVRNERLGTDCFINEHWGNNSQTVRPSVRPSGRKRMFRLNTDTNGTRAPTPCSWLLVATLKLHQTPGEN